MQPQPLKVYRLERGLTLRALAKLAGVTLSTVDRAEEGHSVTVTTIHKISSALNLEPRAITEFHQLIYSGRIRIRSA